MVPSDLDTPDMDLTTGSNAPQEPERTLERAIGTQIRDLRQSFHLSVGHLANAAAQASAPGRAAIGWPMSVIDIRLSLAQIGKAHAYR